MMLRMKLVLEILEQDINPGTSRVDESHFYIREAARAVVADGSRKIALLYVGKDKYHKLPGGGIDEGEDIPTALARELLEEIGCRAKVLTEIGEVIEHRHRFEMIQKSYCYLAEVVGEKGQPNFTEKELANEFSIVWADNIEAAIDLLENDKPENYEGKSIKMRDLAILRAANV